MSAGYKLRREEFPRFELEIVLVTVPYPGASPDEVERAVCQKIEGPVRPIDGIKKVTSVAWEGSGSVVIELKSSVSDPQKVLNEIPSEVDRIPSFPVLAEKPEIRQLTIRNPTIKVGVVADGMRNEQVTSTTRFYVAQNAEAYADAAWAAVANDFANSPKNASENDNRPSLQRAGNKRVRK